MKKIIFTIALGATFFATSVHACCFYYNRFQVFTFQVGDQCYLTGYKFIPNSTLQNYHSSDVLINNQVFTHDWRDSLVNIGQVYKNKIVDSFEIFSFPASELQDRYFVKSPSGGNTYVKPSQYLTIPSITFGSDGDELLTKIESSELHTGAFFVTVRAIDNMGNETYADFLELNPKEKQIDAEDYSYDDFSRIRDYQSTLHNYTDYKVVEFLIKDQRGNIVYRKTAFDNRSSTKLYPTMASNLLHIQTDLSNGAVKFTNINGAQAGEIYFEQSNAAMDISQLARGMYIANVFSNNQLVYTTKIFKQ
jgi:hypothetical protein